MGVGGFAPGGGGFGGGASSPLEWPLIFGANMNNAGQHLRVNGTTTEGELGGVDSGSEEVVHRAGNIFKIVWNSIAASTDTDLKILVDGEVQHTVTLTGISGTLDISPLVAVAEGSEVAVEFDAGTAPTFIHVKLWVRATS